MTLLSSLRRLPDTDVISINFSSETSSDTLIRTLELHGQYRKSTSGEIFSPKNPGQWLVLFCDEINLPKPDNYGTQRVISFMRQLIEHRGFWRSDRVWVIVENVQVIGACNPPTDPGRVPLSMRFLRHCPVVFVDYPEDDSLITIYGTFARAALKCQPSLRGYSESLTQAMVQFYLACQSRFTSAKQPHYIYSPRELTRWVRGILEIILPAEYLGVESLIRIWAHEGIRLFQDRLVDQDEREWTENKLMETASENFPGINLDAALAQPILFSNFLTKEYESSDRQVLSDFIKERLQTFYEEELDIPLVLFDSALDHILRIDRVFRQTQGHLLLIGISGSGKSTLTRFVSWMNGITVFQPAMHSKYSISDFENDLRTILKKAGCKGEKVVFILDEANVLDSSFLERINTLLANAEIPGLFEGDDFTALMSLCKDSATREGFVFETYNDLYAWFTKQVATNLHVVFTMNPPKNGGSSKATTSPALFNRCVLNWMGDWNHQALYQVSNEFTALIDLEQAYTCPISFHPIYTEIKAPFSFRDIVLDFFIFIHESATKLNDQIGAKLLQTSFITPRQFIDFVTNFSKIYNEKRSQLEDRQRHLIVGLERLRDTFDQVEKLRKSLDIKKAELEIKTNQANEKLKKMVEDQQEAENKRATSVEIQKALAEKNIAIEERKHIAQAELAQAEPAVIEAQESVSSIKKQHLTEVRSMGNPPAAVKLAMESVCILLGFKVDSWKTVQTILRRDDFISSIVNYDTKKLNANIREEINNSYLSDPNYTFEIVNRASKACGPLVNWVMAQVSYATILEKVGPLRNELKTLEASAAATEIKAAETNAMIEELETSIHVYKEEYAVLISEVQTLKKEMDLVKDRVGRSMRVLENLSSEQERWEESKDNFGEQMDTLVGDVILTSGFLSYGGIFDQTNRTKLLNTWKSRLSEAKVHFHQQLSIPAYLSTTEDRNFWNIHSLPADNLCIENAVMLQRCQRYPLVIDPSGQALIYLKSMYKSKNMTITSFRDGSFLKNLESALRFGNPIIIQDAEDFDPILNPILNKEIRRSGGRNLIKLGKKDVDFAASFSLFLFTKTAINFSADICSRVTFVNFTITPGSLLLQCLDRYMKSERPDIDSKRKDLLKLQGEFQLRLHSLEKQLLEALNDSTGNILEDDKVMNTLETLKNEASEIILKVAETDEVLAEVEAVTALYRPLAEKSSSIYFCIEKLRSIQYFYEFSLEYFFQLFDKVLETRKGKGQDRLDMLEDQIFMQYFHGISFSLHHSDLVLFSLLLAHIKTKGQNSSLNDEYEWAFWLTSNDSIDANDISPTLVSILGNQGAQRIQQLSKIVSFNSICEVITSNAAQWGKIISEHNPELSIDQILAKTSNIFS